MTGSCALMSRGVAWVVWMALAAVGGAGAFAAVGPDDFAARRFTDSKGGALVYRLFVPRGYDASRRYPIVTFLHGRARKGSDNRRQITHGSVLWATPEVQAKHPCFVLAPQCPKRDGWGRPEGWPGFGPSQPVRTVLELLDALAKEFSIDPKRQYITGQSSGGGGVLKALLLAPKRFAAAAPVCPGGRLTPEQMAARAKQIRHVPLWFFHGTRDPLIPVGRTRRMVQALRQAGGKPRYTEYPNAKHNCWLKAYAEPELPRWLFAQSLDYLEADAVRGR